MSKRDKKPAKPNIAPAALLRARLERLWLNPAAAHTAAGRLEAELTTITRGLKPEAVAEGVVSVFQAAPAGTQAQLEVWLPRWLADQKLLDTLERLTQTGRLAEALQPTAERWLAAAGRVVGPRAVEAPGAFYKAWEVDDGSQAAVTVLWYSNRHQNRVTGLQALIDYHPPWEGALKDAFRLPNKSPKALEQRLSEVWPAKGMARKSLEAAAAKRKLLVALQQNRAALVRLPEGLVLLREQFFEHVLALPDAPDTPAFSPDDFHTLSQTGRSAEDLILFEQTVGRRIRLEDGQELLIDASIANGDFDEWDDEAPLTLE